MEETQAPKKSIIRSVILLFGLLIAAIIGNGIYSTLKNDKVISEHAHQELRTKLNMVLSIQNNEMDKLRIISAIVTEQRQEYCSFIDYDNTAAITYMLKTLAKIHDIDLAFIFYEYGDLLTTYPLGTQLEHHSIYGSLISNRKVGVDVEKICAEIVERQIPAFGLKSDHAHILCFKSVLRLLSDVGDVYAYVVLIKLINGNHKLAKQMAHIGKAEIVYYDRDNNTVLTSFEEPKIPYPKGGEISLEGKTYLTSMKVIKDFSGQIIGNLVLALDNQPFLEQRMRMFLNSLLPFLLSAIISVALFVLLKRRVFNRINRLLATLRRIRKGKGDLSIRLRGDPEKLEASPSDEVEQIYIDFDHTMDDLENTRNKMIEAQKAVEDSNRELESRVRERTSQLLKMNEALKQEIEDRKHAEKERAELESQLQQSQKMEAIGTLAGGIAHDFNNILAIILGNAELASDDIPHGNPAISALGEIQQASIRAKDMVHQLLSFSRKAGEVSKPLDMVPIIKESMKMLRSSIPTSIEFKQQFPHEQCSIMGDDTQISQIVMNLVTNAADAMSENGGLLEMTLENIFLPKEKTCFNWVLSPGPYVRLGMKDTGEGIEPKIMDRIFDPYYTTKEVGKGTGMGLSVIHGIVKSHDGGVRVESKLGEGTLFEIYFPALEKMSEEEKKSEGQIKGGSEKILFVDDEESVVKLNHQLLERLGYQVQSTTKPLEALEWFKADPDQFDVIITDMTMPRLTGDRLAAEVLKIRPQMSVIICTGYSERMSTEKAEALGARKYLEKPIDLLNLASSLREVIEGK